MQKHLSLRSFIEYLESEGELKRVRTKVSPELEISEITDRVTKTGGPALLFEFVDGSNFPLLINLFGTYRRMSMALGVDNIGDVADKLAGLLTPPAGESIIDKLKSLKKLEPLMHYVPKIVTKAPCQESVMDNPDLNRLPIMKVWPLDGGRFITFGLVFTAHLDTGEQNCGIYRMQVFSRDETGMHWQLHKDGTRHYELYRNKNKRMPVSVAIGADPITAFSGCIPAPTGIDEMMIAGLLRSKRVPLIKCITNDLMVPADAEFILEGYVEPNELRKEGPFGDHTGYYSLADEYPVFHIKKITHRSDAIYQSIIVGRPPQEDCFMGYAVGRIFLPVIKKQLPEIVDISMPFEGVFHNMMIISIKKSYPGHAQKIINAVWGMGQAMFTKVVVVVDDDVNIHDASETVWKVLNHIDPERDLTFTRGSVDMLDHASRLPGYGSKVGIDATRKWRGEGFIRDWPQEIKMSDDIRKMVDERWKDYGIGHI